MSEILMYVSNGLIIISFLLYLILMLINRKNIIEGKDGFNVTKDILHEYDSINIIENAGYFTIYNIKRRVIKIASRCYYGNNISDIAIPLIEAGISGIDNGKNKVINFFRKIIPNLKCLYVLPLLAISINSITYNISDAKIGLVFLVIFSFICYYLININTEVLMWVDERIKKLRDINQNNKMKIINYINNILIINKILFIGQLVMIIRFVAIILQID